MMTFAPPLLARQAELIVTPWSYQSLGVALSQTGQGSPSSVNYVAANVVIFVPFWTPTPMTITKLFWTNGAAVAGNLDVGVYKPDGTLVISTGSVAQAGTTNLQATDVTDTLIEHGLYYMAIVSDTSGATQKVRAASPAAGIPQSLGLLEQASVTLPLATNASPATFAKYTRALIPDFGLQGFRVIGP